MWGKAVEGGRFAGTPAGGGGTRPEVVRPVGWGAAGRRGRDLRGGGQWGLEAENAGRLCAVSAPSAGRSWPLPTEALEPVWRRGVQALAGRGASGCSRTLLRGGERAGRPAPCVGCARSLCGVLFALAWGRWGPRRRWPGGSPWSVAFPDDRGISAHVPDCWLLAGCQPARRILQVGATCSCKSWRVDVGPGAGGCCSVLPEGPPAPTQALPPSPGPAGSLTGASWPRSSSSVQPPGRSADASDRRAIDFLPGCGGGATVRRPVCHPLHGCPRGAGQPPDTCGASVGTSFPALRMEEVWRAGLWSATPRHPPRLAEDRPCHSPAAVTNQGPFSWLHWNPHRPCAVRAPHAFLPAWLGRRVRVAAVDVRVAAWKVAAVQDSVEAVPRTPAAGGW